MHLHIVMSEIECGGGSRRTLQTLPSSASDALSFVAQPRTQQVTEQNYRVLIIAKDCKQNLLSRQNQ